MTEYTYGDGKPKPAGTWDFYGYCSDDPQWKTFSLGIFEWTEKSSGKGAKRGKVVYRVKGETTNKQPAFDKALAMVKKYNDPTFASAKATALGIT